MDKKQLNLEIILCRALVKKVRVCVVRKLLKKIKILRSTKNEKNREKKFKKARRLVAEIHVMKTLRPDYVTKFALLTENYVPAGSNTKLNRKRNACAKIAKHGDLMAKINAIRNKFVNWREELPQILESAKKKKPREAVTDEPKIENSSVCEESEQCRTENINSSSEGEEETSESDLGVHPAEVEKSDSDGTSEGDGSDQSNKIEMTEPEDKTNIAAVPTLEVLKSSNVKAIRKTDVVKKTKFVKKVEEISAKEEKRSFQKEMEDNDEAAVEEKIDDPFFLGKKIIVPKLLQKGNENHPENENVRKRARMKDVEEVRLKKKRNVIHEREQVRAGKEKMEKWEQRRREPLTDDELHPSWKAKKMHAIKPFQGKIIKFE